jgi:hypothetical protein
MSPRLDPGTILRSADASWLGSTTLLRSALSCEEFEQLMTRPSPVDRPVQNKLRAVLGRRAIRNVVVQSLGLVIGELLAERKVLVVNLAKGSVGEGSSRSTGRRSRGRSSSGEVSAR